VHSFDSVADYTLSHHAQLRAAQRGLTQQDIEYVLRYGHLSHAGGAMIYFLRSVDIPDDDYRHMKWLEGTAVLVNRGHSSIITTWRNRKHGSRNIRHKMAQRW
jgi:hypothetical protein